MFPTTTQISKGLERFASEIVIPRENDFKHVVLEEQPNMGNKTNFRLQQIDVGLRGIFAGRKILHIVSASAVRKYFGTDTGVYAENKKVHLEKCVELGIAIEGIPADKKQHVADTVVQFLYLCAKKFPNLVKDSYARKQIKHNRNTGKGRPKRQPHSKRRPPSLDITRDGTSL